MSLGMTTDQFCRYNDEILGLQRQLAQANAVIKEQKETIDSLNALAKFDHETVESTLKHIDEQSELIEKLAAGIKDDCAPYLAHDAEYYAAVSSFHKWKENK